VKFGEIILNPSWTRPYTYQGHDLSDGTGVFGCVNCQEKIVVPFSNLLENKKSIDEETENTLCKLFDVPIVGKSHDGGWPRFENVVCASCGQGYVAYIGVNETSNSVYGVTLQGVIQCDT